MKRLSLKRKATGKTSAIDDDQVIMEDEELSPDEIRK